MALSKQRKPSIFDAIAPEVASLLRTIDGQLYLLGWTRENPRVTKFLEAVRRKHNLTSLALEQIPFAYLKRLSDFLKIYSHCDQLIKKLGLNWTSPIVTELTAEYGGCDKMPILGWRHLYESLENEYFLSDLPKPAETKKRGKNVRRTSGA